MIADVQPNLSRTDQPPAEQYDVGLLDLDGVVYVGADAVPGAPAALAEARARGMRLAFVTNNAARPPAAVARHLTELGIDAEAGEVITSSQAAARYLAERLPAGAEVLVVGTTGLREALAERGLAAVDAASEQVAAVVQGYSPTLDWAQLAEGAVAINRGVPWVATNTDPTVPSPRGPLPGNGSLVAALRLATGRDPVVTGKPDPTMHRETMIRTGARRALVVGDRLDTDIEGARAVGCPSLLVLSGVTGPSDLLDAVPEHRPDYLAADVAGLLLRHESAEFDGSSWRLGPWQVTADTLDISGPTDRARVGAGVDADETDLDLLRVLCPVVWGSGATWAELADSVSADDASRNALVRLGLMDGRTG